MDWRTERTTDRRRKRNRERTDSRKAREFANFDLDATSSSSLETRQSGLSAIELIRYRIPIGIAASSMIENQVRSRYHASCSLVASSLPSRLQ